MTTRYIGRAYPGGVERLHDANELNAGLAQAVLLSCFLCSLLLSVQLHWGMMSCP